jgi:hypothetical protein
LLRTRRIGTVLELSTIWQLIQVRKLRNDAPLILVGRIWSDRHRRLQDYENRTDIANFISGSGLLGAFHESPRLARPSNSFG